MYNIKIFAHDAASANCVMAYVFYKCQNIDCEITAYPKGPAIKIFSDSFLDKVVINNDCQYKFSVDDIVITGLSGVYSNYELDIIKIARSYGVKDIISILDVPRGLDDRLIVNNPSLLNMYLPNRILAPTKERNLSRYAIVNSILEYSENQYWQYIYETSYKNVPKLTSELIKTNKYNYLVFFTEYIKDQFGCELGCDEFSIIKDFVDVFGDMNIQIIIKLHPSESMNKYKRYTQGKSNIFTIKEEVSTQEALYYARIVFGITTSVFYEALMCNKEAYSLQIGCEKDMFELTKNNSIRKIQTKDELYNLYQKIMNNIEE